MAHNSIEQPLRAILRITDRAVERLSSRFDALSINFGRTVPTRGHTRY
jgi:hypothetical protein